MDNSVVGSESARYRLRVTFFQWHPAEEEEDDELAEENDEFDSPSHFLGGVVPLELLIARSETAAVAVRSIVAYPDGFERTVVGHVRLPPRQRRFHGAVMMLTRADLDYESMELPPAFLRFGLEFPDGARVTNLEETWRVSEDASEPAHGMEATSGSGSDTRYEQEFWVWPVPGPGTLTIVCEWPAHGIRETRIEIDAGVISAAAERAQVVWPDDDGTLSRPTQRPMLARLRERSDGHGLFDL